jgi:hypothetical protein
MNLPTLTEAVRTPVYPAGVLAVLGCVLAGVLRKVRRSGNRPPVAVVTAAIAALLCTAYSGDTSWRFARDHLGMASGSERAVMFAAAELGLFSMALMARQNLRAVGAPGTPGVLVWVVTGVQVIPAYSEAGLVAGTVRAFVGPVLAALLWHLAMGIELRHVKPGEESQSLPAVLVREARERLLSRLGLSRRGRDAAQITRDRWTRIATQRAARLADLQEADQGSARRRTRARRRLAVAVDRTDAGVLEPQRAVLLDRIAAYRGAASLASMELPAPWQRQPEPAPMETVVERVPAPQPVPEVQPQAYPQILAGVPGPDSELYPAAPSGSREPAAVPAAGAPRTRPGVQAEYAYPALPRAVPDVVPAGVRLLPIVARPTPAVPEPIAHDPGPEDSLHALRYRIGDEAFLALWPEQQPEPEDDSPPPPGEDTLTATARADFLDRLVDGCAPSIRDLKARYVIGQTRATRIQSELKKRLA